MLAPVSRIEVADLFQPQNQFEDVPDRGPVAHFRQSHDAFVFGQPIAFSLLGREVQTPRRGSVSAADR